MNKLKIIQNIFKSKFNLLKFYDINEVELKNILLKNENIYFSDELDLDKIKF